MLTPIRLQFTLRQGDFELTLDEVVEARVLAVYGPSGAGKTTMLEAIAGWRRPRSGAIEVGGRVLYASASRIDLPVHRRRIGYVAQDGLLFPHLTVAQNVRYGRSGHDAAVESQVASMLDVADLMDRAVGGLSGGERQRVALARALVASPSLLLLDEPLAAIDVARRQRILPYVRRIRDELDVPMIYVTHQSAEAREVADQVVLLDAGRVTARGPVDLLPA